MTIYRQAHQSKADKQPAQPIPGCELSYVQRWRGPSTRTRAARDPWKWEENGLPATHGSRKGKQPTEQELESMTPWQRFKAQANIDAENAAAAAATAAAGGGGGAEGGAAGQPPAPKTPRKLLRNFPGIDEAQLRRLNAYCGHSYERAIGYIESFVAENASPVCSPGKEGGWAGAAAAAAQYDVGGSGGGGLPDGPAAQAVEHLTVTQEAARKQGVGRRSSPFAGTAMTAECAELGFELEELLGSGRWKLVKAERRKPLAAAAAEPKSNGGAPRGASSSASLQRNYQTQRSAQWAGRLEHSGGGGVVGSSGSGGGNPVDALKAPTHNPMRVLSLGPGGLLPDDPDEAAAAAAAARMIG
eukprot:SAG22_NODE_369_length_11597_cov_4.374848_2_plen_357_part_01